MTAWQSQSLSERISTATALWSEPTAAQSTITVVGANGSPIYNQSVIISKPAFARGDVNGDGSVSISDVTALIDYLLNGNPSSISLSAADCNQDGSVSIGDVTVLIDYLLKGTW